MLRDARADGQGHAVESPVDQRDRRLLACARCRLAITSPADRIEISGAHGHTFTNPLGGTFRIGCFGAASGLLPVGPSSLEWTWFLGYTWQSQVCAGCSAFMGWLYRRREHRFHGLVVDALIEIDQN